MYVLVKMCSDTLVTLYKQWCDDAANGNIQYQFQEREMAISPLDRNVSTTALVYRDKKDRLLDS